MLPVNAIASDVDCSFFLPWQRRAAGCRLRFEKILFFGDANSFLSGFLPPHPLPPQPTFTKEKKKKQQKNPQP